MSIELEVLKASRYAEFPDVITTLQLCRACAVRDGRKVAPSMRECARIIHSRAQNKALRDTLAVMSKSAFPEVELTRLRSCLDRMIAAMRRELRDVESVKC